MAHAFALLTVVFLSASLPAAASQKAAGSAGVATPRAARDEPEKKAAKSSTARPLTEEGRLALVRKSQLWTPTDVAAMDLRAGPQGKGAFAPNQKVTCSYVEDKNPTGKSRKFKCALAPDDVVKVRYGTTNGEVQGSVIGSRLLWALGFGADRVYPVRVTCEGCSPDPWNKRDPVPGARAIFDPAVIERKPEGTEMKAGDKDAGWAWPELVQIDAVQGGSPRPQRDALTLLAIFMQHTDSKIEQQRLICLPGGLTADGTCTRPFLLVHDVGLTFGHGTFSNNQDRATVNFAEWSSTPVWRDAESCVAHMSRSLNGTLGNPKISEAGRAFLAGLLGQLSNTQLRDLFEVAGVERRKTIATEASSPASVDEWVNAFKRKRDEIAMHRCPS